MKKLFRYLFIDLPEKQAHRLIMTTLITVMILFLAAMYYIIYLKFEIIQLKHIIHLLKK
jgi:hypothetical protein